MSGKPQLTITRHGKPVPNPAAGASAHAGKPTIKPLQWYGNVEHIRFVLDFYTKERRKKVQVPNRYARTVDALMQAFAIGEAAAKNAIAALAAYRADVFQVNAPAEVAELADDFRRIADKAEAAKDWHAAIAARRELGKLVGAYSPVKVDITHHEAPTPVADQLGEVFAALSPESQGKLEHVLGEIEQARQAKEAARLQLVGGEQLVIDAQSEEKAG